MKDFNAKSGVNQGKDKLVCSLKIKNNIIYDIDFNTEDKKTKREVIKLVKNKVLSDVESISSKDSKIILFLNAAKEAVKDYKEKQINPLLRIIDIIEEYDEGFPKRRVEDEYESCSNAH